MTKDRSRLCSAALRSGFGLLLATPASAEQAPLTLDPTVVTGTQGATPSFALPFSIDVIDAAQIRDGQLGINASESLNRVPGLVVQNRQNYAQDLQISIRGFGAQSAFGVRGVRLLADGIPATAPDGQGQAATFDLDSAERIEVLRGPFASVYGNHAGGVIQLFSRNGEGPPRVSTGLTAGPWGFRKSILSAEGAQDALGYVVDVSRFDTDGYRRHSAATRDKGFAKLTLRPDAQSELSLIASSLRQQDTQDPLGLTWNTYRRDPRGVEANAELFDTRKSIDHRQAGLNYQRSLDSGDLQLTLYSGNRRVQQFLAIPPAAQRNPSQAGGVVEFERRFQGLGTRWTQEREAGAGQLTLTFGLDYDRSVDDRQGYENFSGERLGVQGALRRDETDRVSSLAPYLQASWALDDWTLMTGLRYSRVGFEVQDDFLANGDDGGERRYTQATPSLGLLYRANPDLHLYASLARGFETPTLGELAYSSAGGGFNFDLQPVRSRQIELGAKAFIGEHSRLNAAIFQIDSDDELVVASASGGRAAYRNAASTRRRGFELALETQLAEQWQATLAFTQLQAVYDQGYRRNGASIAAGNRLPGVSARTAFAELVWTSSLGVTAALEALYRDKVYVEDSNQEKAAPAYSLLNLRISAEQQRGDWTFSQLLRLDNLLDRAYIGSVIVGDSQGRYYEPGPTFGVYAGLNAEYSF